MKMIVNQAAIELVQKFEGFSATPYKDSAGVWTIGFGTTRGITKDTPPITRAQATLLLIDDLQAAANCVQIAVHASLTANQYSALYSLVYNIGIKNFLASTLLRLLNNGNYKAAAEQFLVWNKITVAGVHEISPGLTNRRIAERALFLTKPKGSPDNVNSH